MTLDWYEWGQILFEKAVKEDKPIFLYLDDLGQDEIQKVTQDLHKNKLILERLKNSFLPVFINSQERPDITARYHQGGLPSLVFLTPRGQVISGYAGESLESLADFLEQVAGIYKAAAWGGQFSNVQIAPAVGASFEEKRLYLIRYKEQFLSAFQNLATRNLSPDPDVLEFCLKKYIKTEDQTLKTYLEKSLENLAEGEGFDFLDGGFFSHQFKKRLSHNLRLAKICSSAAKVLGDERFSQTAQKTLEFINRWLYNFDTGSFYSSLSSEENYYKLASRLERLAYREQRHQPQTEETIYTDLNAQAADFYFNLGQGEVALKTINFLLTSLRSPEGLFFHFQKKIPDLNPSDPGSKNWFLADQVYLTKCLLNPVLQSSALSSDLKPKTLVQDIWQLIMEKFYDVELGGFFDRRLEVEDWGLLKNRFKSVPENVEAIRILKELGYEEEARRSLIEIFWQNKTPSLRLASLATLLLEF